MLKNSPSTLRLNQAQRALLIEDDEVDCLIVLRSLEGGARPYICDHASLLSEAKELINSNRYDIIISDMNLPDSDGLDTIKSILSMVNKTPIIVLSGNEDENVALDAVHAGAQDFIPKQYINDEGLMRRVLRYAIERHKLRLGLEKTQERERFLAHYDQCTALPNRVLFLDRLYQSIMHSQREEEPFSLCFIDLDRFKDVNDTMGHAAGDEVLRSVGMRIKKVLRESDTIARFGGDEFVIILKKTDEIQHLHDISKKIIDSVNQPIPFGKHQCSVGASIGIACYPNHGESAEQLLKHADMAMYEAKNLGRNQFQLFNDQLLEKKSRSYNQEKMLREALHQPDKHFSLSFQPKVELESGEVHSVEGLIRWKHPDKGNIEPDLFIPLAESLGLINQIDKWVIETACKQIIHWRPIDPTIRIGINISSISFNQDDFINTMFIPFFEQYKVSGHNFEIEITEGVLLENSEKVHQQLTELKTLGFTVAVDNFGSGFSSLSYLNQLPIDTLKIDGSFMCDIDSDKSEQTVLKAIVALGRALELKIVAECIETDAQRQHLSKLHCDEGQGFLWGQPDAEWSPQKNQNEKKASF